VEVIEDMQVDVDGSLVNKLLCLSGLADGQSPDFSGCTTSTASRLALLRLVCFEAAQHHAPDTVLEAYHAARLSWGCVRAVMGRAAVQELPPWYSSTCRHIARCFAVKTTSYVPDRLAAAAAEREASQCPIITSHRLAIAVVDLAWLVTEAGVKTL